ncbi:MAG: hypothetical protein ACLQDV_24490 [Candidatus Binataceae bacterium]
MTVCGATEQIFSVAYRCASCSSTTIQVLVKRDGLKLTLTGRSEFERLAIPDFIPEPQANFYRSAILAFRCNEILNGICLLRIFIEQFMKSEAPGTYETGDALCDAYKTTVSDAFKSIFPSMNEIYSALSHAIHEARTEAAVFEEQLAKIDNHFRGRSILAANGKLKPPENR